MREGLLLTVVLVPVILILLGKSRSGQPIQSPQKRIAATVDGRLTPLFVFDRSGWAADCGVEDQKGYLPVKFLYSRLSFAGLKDVYTRHVEGADLEINRTYVGQNIGTDIDMP